MAEAVSIPIPESALSSLDWKAVERGIPLSALEKFSAHSGISMKELLEVVIPLRTLKHRRQRKESLNMDESDRLIRAARIFELAVRVYGNHEDALKWLTSSKARFDGRSAFSMLRTESGERAVEEFLVQIDEGMFV